MFNRDLKWIIFGVTGLIFCHATALYGRFDRDPSTLKNGFMYDHILLQHSLVLTGHARIGGLPLTPEQRWTRLLPVDMPGESGTEILDAMWRNRPQAEAVYRNQLPVGYVLGSVPAMVFGPSFWTLRMGLLFPLALLLMWTWDIGRRLHSHTAGFYAAALVGLLPCVWQSLFLSKIVLCSMALVAGVLWSLLWVTMRFSWVGSVIFAGLLILATRGGEYVSDGLLCLAALLPVIAVQGGGFLVDGLRQKQWRKALPFALGLGLALLGIDWLWLSSHGTSYVVAEAGLEQSGFQWSQWFFNLQSYLWMFQHSLFLPAGIGIICLGLLSNLKVRPQAFSLGLMISILAGLTALSIPNKLQDYYIMPFVPAMVILTGIGLAAIKNWGRVFFGVGALGLLLTYGQGVLKPEADGMLWQRLDPALAPAPTSNAQAWFADWRRQSHHRQGALRQSLAKWLVQAKSEWIHELPSDAVVVIPWNTGNQTYDGMATLLMSLRPDVLVLNIDLNKKDSVASDILRSSTKSYWVLVPQDAHRGVSTVVQGWGGTLIQSFPEGNVSQLSIFELQANESQK